ncbi:MAG: hypothetical protein ACYDAE_17085 [Steroidobacteraceae bacterium]
MVKTLIYAILPFLCASNAFDASAAKPAVLARGPATHAYLLFLTEIDHHFGELRAARSSMRSALRRAAAHPQADIAAAPLDRLLRSSAAECTAVGVLLASGTPLVPTGTMLADADDAYFERTEMAAEDVACDERVLAVDLEAHLQSPGNSTADERADNRKLMNDESAYFRSIGETFRHFGYTQAAGMSMLRSRGLLRSSLFALRSSLSALRSRPDVS